jgi:nucleoside 2-deoxyribosyltransferase
MKTFIAYGFTGQDPKQLEPVLTAACNALKKKGIEYYCSFFEEDDFKSKQYNARQIMNHAFTIIDDIDFLLVIQMTENKSEGMLMEVGYCIAKNIPIVAATKRDVKQTYLPDMAEVRLVWDGPEQLTEEIAKTDLQAVAKAA